jgi:hypothetical protein
MMPDQITKTTLLNSEALREAALTLAEKASQRILLFSDYLDHQLYDNSLFYETLSNLARMTHHTEIKILVKQTEYLAKRGHRLVDLYRRMPSSIPVRKLDYCPENYLANYLIVDDSGILFIPNREKEPNYVSYGDRPLVKHQALEFNDSWEKSVDDPELRQLTF